VSGNGSRLHLPPLHVLVPSYVNRSPSVRSPQPLKSPQHQHAHFQISQARCTPYAVLAGSHTILKPIVSKRLCNFAPPVKTALSPNFSTTGLSRRAWTARWLVSFDVDDLVRPDEAPQQHQELHAGDTCYQRDCPFPVYVVTTWA